MAALPRFAVARAALISAGLAAVTGLVALADAAVNHSYWFTAEHVRTSPLPPSSSWQSWPHTCACGRRPEQSS